VLEVLIQWVFIYFRCEERFCSKMWSANWDCPEL